MKPSQIDILSELEKKVLWLASWTIHNANHLRDSVDGLKVGGHQASSASLATIMTALYFDVLRPQDRVAVKPHASPIFHAIQYLLGKQTREKLENFRGYKGAQSYPSRTKDIDDVDFSTGSVGLGVAQTLVLVDRAGLCARAWFRQGQAGRPHDRAGRRCRARRRQYLRVAAGRLEAGPAQLLVDRRLQPPEPRRGGARRAVGTLRAAVQEFRLGGGDRQIRRPPGGRVPRAGRREAAGLDRCLPESALFRAGVSGRSRVAQAPARRDRRSGRRHEVDREALRRRTGAADEQSRRPRSAGRAQGIPEHHARQAGLLHLLHREGLRPADGRAQGQPCRPDDAGADGYVPRPEQCARRP